VSTHVLCMKAAEYFLGTSQCTYFTEKSGLRDVKRADFIRYWRRSGFKNPDKPNIFIKKNLRNHSHPQFYPVLAKIRINRGLLYIRFSKQRSNVTFREKRHAHIISTARLESKDSTCLLQIRRDPRHSRLTLTKTRIQIRSMHATSRYDNKCVFAK